MTPNLDSTYLGDVLELENEDPFHSQIESTGKARLRAVVVSVIVIVLAEPE